MAKPRHKGKSKQKKPNKVVEAKAVKVQDGENEQPENEEVLEVNQEPQEEVKNETLNAKPEDQTLSEKEQKKLEKEQAKKDKQIAKEKALKKKKEADEKSGKLTIGQRIKETGSELKKISWPTFGQTMKKTGVVIAVVLFFAVVLFAFDYVLSLLQGLII